MIMSGRMQRNVIDISDVCLAALGSEPNPGLWTYCFSKPVALPSQPASASRTGPRSARQTLLAPSMMALPAIAAAQNLDLSDECT